MNQNRSAQPMMIVGLVVAVLLVFGTTFALVKSFMLSSDVVNLQSSVAMFEGSGGGTGLKVGVVRINFIGQEYSSIPDVSQFLQDQLGDYESQLSELENSRQSGQITEQEYVARINELRTRINEASVELIARPIQNAVNQIGIEEEYDLIVKAEDVVLFSQGGLMEDITQDVLERMIRNRE